MKNTAIFYSSSSGDTKEVANEISSQLDQIKKFDIKITTSDFIRDYDNLIFGISTYNRGTMQNEWEKIWEDFSKIDFNGKKVAIFGLGDQKNYPNNFVDAMGILYEQLKKSNAEMIGFTSTKSYDFNSSKAVVEDQFVGLAIDLINQKSLTLKRVKKWVEQLKNDFN
ncbi:MAG: flavodoxin [Halarcobacter sp.]